VILKIFILPTSKSKRKKEKKEKKTQKIKHTHTKKHFNIALHYNIFPTMQRHLVLYQCYFPTCAVALRGCLYGMSQSSLAG
jgi:hypothetical protein